MNPAQDGMLVIGSENEREHLLNALAVYMLNFPEHDGVAFDLMFKIAKVEVCGTSQKAG